MKTAGNFEINTVNSQVTGSLQTLRNVVIDETAKMATSAPSHNIQSTQLATDILQRITRFEDEIGLTEKEVPELMSAESLYRPLFSDTAETAITAGISRIYRLVNEYDKHLDNAIKNFDDIIFRETEMTLFRRMPYELDYLNISGSNIGEVSTALKVALIGNTTKPYFLPQIISLRKVLKLIKNDISVGEPTLAAIFDILDDTFGLAGPLAEVSFFE